MKCVNEKRRLRKKDQELNEGEQQTRKKWLGRMTERKTEQEKLREKDKQGGPK